MDKCVFLLFDELVCKIEEVVLTVTEVKVLYKVIAVYVSLSLRLLHLSCICPFIHLPGSNTQAPQPYTSHRKTRLYYYYYITTTKMSLNKAVSDLHKLSRCKRQQNFHFLTVSSRGRNQRAASLQHKKHHHTAKPMNHKSEPTHCAPGHNTNLEIQSFIWNSSILIR